LARYSSNGGIDIKEIKRAQRIKQQKAKNSKN
jgi:hypothetical protein